MPLATSCGLIRHFTTHSRRRSSNTAAIWRADEVDVLFTALAHLAAYNHYVIAQPGYTKRVSAFVPDQKEKEE